MQTELVETYPSKEFKLVLQAASKQQKARNDAYLGIDVLLGALLDDRDVGGAITDAGLTKGQLQNAIAAVRSSDTHIDSATGDENFQALNKYGTDLTANAARLDPVIGARRRRWLGALGLGLPGAAAGAAAGDGAGAGGRCLTPPPPDLPCRRARRGGAARGARAVPPHQEQPRAGGRAGRGQDRHRGGPGAAHRQGGRAGC